MEKCLLAIALGAVALLCLPVLPDSQWLVMTALMLLLAAIRWRGVWVLVCLMLSMAWATWHAQHYLDERPPFALEDKPFKVEVQIVGLPENTPFGLRFRVKPLRLRSNIVYTLPSSTDWLLSSNTSVAVRPEQIWLMTVTLRRPHGVASPGAFDYQQWLMSEGISATGKVSRGQLLHNATGSFDEWRLQIRERFEQHFANNANAAVSLALLTGDRALITDKTWELYAATGISHLMAISGVHVMLAASMVAWGVMHLLRLWPQLFLHWPLQQLLLPITLTIALAYGCLAGLSLPTMRTLMMVSLSILLTWLRHETSVSKILLRAFVLMVLWQPLSVHAIGFWLSFGAVALLLLWSGWQRQEQSWLAFGRLQVWLTLALLPLTLCFFGRLSLVSPVANLLAIPVVSVVIVPLDLLGLALGIASEGWQIAIWHTASTVVGWLNACLMVLANWPWAQQFWVLSPLALGCLTLAILWLLLPRQLVARPLAMVMLLPVLFALPKTEEGTLRMSVLDVGQGLSVLLQTQHHSLLYDTGANFNTGERVVSPYLRWSRLHQLDVLMISHNDKDHTGGANAVLAHTPVAHAYYSASPEGYRLPASTTQTFCQAGQHWQWDGITFQVLSPTAHLQVKKDNDRSCVLKIRGKNFSVLLTGDIEAPAEQVLVRTGSPLQAEVLVLAHHGSKTSSTPAFLAAVQPKRAIVSAGYHNQFGHPSPSVEQRLGKAQVVIDSTIEGGTLIYHFQPQHNLHTQAWRERGHYWLNSP